VLSVVKKVITLDLVVEDKIGNENMNSTNKEKEIEIT